MAFSKEVATVRLAVCRVPHGRVQSVVEGGARCALFTVRSSLCALRCALFAVRSSLCAWVDAPSPSAGHAPPFVQSVVEDFVKDVQAKYKADRAVLKEAYKAMPKTPATPQGHPAPLNFLRCFHYATSPRSYHATAPLPGNPVTPHPHPPRAPPFRAQRPGRNGPTHFAIKSSLHVARVPLLTRMRRRTMKVTQV